MSAIAGGRDGGSFGLSRAEASSLSPVLERRVSSMSALKFCTPLSLRGVRHVLIRNGCHLVVASRCEANVLQVQLLASDLRRQGRRVAAD